MDERNEMEVWKNYIQYLKDWSSDHESDLFYGMSPACFDEWDNDEWLEF